MNLLLQHKGLKDELDENERVEADDGYKDGDLEFVKNYEGDINVNDSDGWTPLHIASCYSNLEIVKCLVSKGADINRKDIGGRTPLHNASRWGEFEIVKYLIKKGADVKIRDNDRKTPLHWASYNNHIETVKYLLDNGAEKIKIKSEWNNEVKEILLTY